MAVAVFLGGCAGQAEKPSDQIDFRYIAPGFKPANYHHVLVDPGAAFPKPEPTAQVSMDTLLNLQAKLTRLFEDIFCEAYCSQCQRGRSVLSASA